MDKVKKIITLSFLSFVLVFGISGCKNNTVVNNDNTIQKEINNQEKINKKEEVRQETKTKATTTEKIATTSIITSSIDTSDWKTYRNEEYGFEVKYPSGYFVRDNNKYVKQPKGVLGVIYFKTDNSNFNDFGISVGISKTSENKYLTDEEYLKNIIQNYDTISYEKKYYLKAQNVILNNINGVMVPIKYSNGTLTLIKKNNILYKIYFLPAGEIDPDIYNAFLLSFKTIK